MHPNTLPSVLDICLTTNANNTLINNIKVLDDIGSDHRPILVETSIKMEHEMLKPSPAPSPDFEKADWRAYKRCISDAMSQAPVITPSKDSLDDAIDFITETIKFAEVEAIPRKKMPSNNTRQLPEDIILLIKEKRRLSNLYQKRKQHE